MMSDTSGNQERLPADHHGHGHGHRRHPWHIRFSDEEQRVWDECKRDSTMYRALPLAALLGVVTFAAVKKGYLRPNARFGAVPKVLIASLIGYGIGKLSYRRTCMKRMMAIPDSHYGHFLKAREGGCGPWGGFSRDGLMMFGGAHPRDAYWGAGPLPREQPSAPEKDA